MEAINNLLSCANVGQGKCGCKCGCGCTPPEVCSAPGDGCGNVIPFANLLNLLTNFCPCSSEHWQNMKISAIPYLHCVLEPCSISDAHLVFTDPCSKQHDLQKYTLEVKRARIIGSIDYIISAQTALSDVSGDHASVSEFYTLRVDHVIGYIEDCNVRHVSVVLDYRNLGLDTPAEYVYGNNHALRIKGEFVLNLGYIFNGGFENGFSGWSQITPPGARADTVMQFNKYCAVDGCYFALLTTDGPGSMNTLSLHLSYANAGDVLSGWSFFETDDYMPFNDSCSVVLKSGSGEIVTLFKTDVESVGDFGRTPWTQWTYSFAEAGQYTLEATICNSLDSTLESYLGLDAVKLTPASL